MASASLSGLARHRAPNNLERRTERRKSDPSSGRDQGVDREAAQRGRSSTGAVRGVRDREPPRGREAGGARAGVLERQLRGVLEVGGAPGVVVLSVCRYACLACKAVMTVVPAGMLARRLYSAPSIALALHLWLLAGLSDRAVRDQVCAWRVRGRSGSGWAQLYRWARQPARVFALPRATGALEGAYALTKRMLTTLRSMAPVSCHAAPIALQVFEGAARTR